MRKNPKKVKKNKQSLLYTPVGIGFLAIVLLYLAYATYGIYSKWSDANQKLLMTKEGYSATVARHNAISDDLHRLSTERGKEEVIREKFNVVKNGEGVVVLPGDGEEMGNQKAESVENKKNFWQYFKEFFAKKDK